MSDKDLEGRCFVQGDCIGLASYHFVSATKAYICYNAAPRSWVLDDGSKPPAQKYFEDAAYNPHTRTFAGKIVWSPVTFGSCARWDYLIVFSPDFRRIAGSCAHAVKVTKACLGSGEKAVRCWRTTSMACKPLLIFTVRFLVLRKFFC